MLVECDGHIKSDFWLLLICFHNQFLEELCTHTQLTIFLFLLCSKTGLLLSIISFVVQSLVPLPQEHLQFSVERFIVSLEPCSPDQVVVKPGHSFVTLCPVFF